MTKNLIALIAAAAISSVATAAFADDVRVDSTVDVPRAVIGTTAADGAAAYGAGTVGAMHFAVAGRATSLSEVRTQSRGLLTTANPTWRAAQPQSGM